MQNRRKNLSQCICLSIALAGLAVTASADSLSKIKMPFDENFSSTNLDSAWAHEVSLGGKISIKDNWITFEAPLPGQSHIERPLNVDNVTASAKLVRWSGIYLVWDAKNWCGVGKLSPTPFGRFYSIDVANGKTNEVNHRGTDFNFPHAVRVQLGRDHVRFEYQLGNNWLELRTIERPKGFSGAPKFLRVGKYYGVEDTPYGAKDPSAKASGAVRELHVEATPRNQLKLTRAELQEVRHPKGEPVNALLRESDDDPTFEKIVGFYPPMRSPREIVGVPAHPLDIGVDRLGRLDVSPWSAGPLAWFEVEESAKAFGQEGVPFTRRLLHGYLPVLTLSRAIDGVDYQMTVFGWSENFSVDKDLFAYVRFSASSDSAKQISMRWEKGGKQIFPLKSIPSQSAQTFFRFKYPEPASATEISADEFAAKEEEVVARWTKKLAPADRFEIPDARVSEAFRAWLVYSMLNADTINGFIEPHDGAGFYEEMFGCSVSLHTRALDLYGFHDYAAQILDTQLHFQQTNGLYTQACGLTDPGSLLVALAKHYEMTGDRKWLQRVAPNIIKQCDWLMRERESAPKSGMMRGLIKFRPYNDYPDPVYNFLGNAWCAIGMKLAAATLKNVDSERGKKFSVEAEKFQRDVLDSMEASATVREGQTLLPMEPDTQRLLKMSKYRGGDYYGLVASSLLETEFLPTTDKRASWIVDALEKRGGLIAGVCEFEDGIDHAYTYGYLMNQLKRDEARKTLLGFWSFLAFGMTRDTYSPVEVTMIKTGENHYTLPHLYSCTDQLRLLRNLLFYENDGALCIGQGTPSAWFKPGKHIAVKSAPTEFGDVSYRVDAVSAEQMRVSLNPPLRRAPKEIRIRLRHPQKQKITSVQTSPETAVTFEDETIVLKNLKTPIDLDVRFAK